jgi:hypothetical protein
MLGGCNQLTEDFYYLQSPDNTKTVTIVNLVLLIEPNGNGGKLSSGIYLFDGEIKKDNVYPKEYLKLEYSDYSPLGIIWDDTIKIAYNFIEKNTYKSDGEILIFSDINNIEYVKSLELSRNNKSYDFDVIFRNYKEN